MEAKYRILESAVSRQRRDTKPVLDQLNSTSVVKQIRIGNKCGSDNICYPALRVSAREYVTHMSKVVEFEGYIQVIKQTISGSLTGFFSLLFIVWRMTFMARNVIEKSGLVRYAFL